MKKTLVFLWMALAVAGCTTTQKASTIGGLGGATLGGIIGHQSGNDITGAAIGGVAGAVGGMLVGEKMETKFCPVGGELYTEDVKFCPIHGVELKERQK